MGELKPTLDRVLRGYTGKAFNGYSTLTSSDDQQHFVITSVANVQGRRVINTALVVHLTDDHIIIDRDINTKPLVDALIQAGIPRTQIILAYPDEPVPESA